MMDGKTGLIVEERSEWMNALSRLIEDTEYRTQLSLNTFQESKRRYDLNYVADLWSSLFKIQRSPMGQLMRKLVSSFVFSILLLSGNGWGATYYVDQTGGNDANNGLSAENAWKTIAKVNVSSYAAGDSILFKRGETWRERLLVPSSGASGYQITYSAYGSGDNPIISGGTIVTGWTDDGDGTYSKASIYDKQADGVFEDGLPLTMATSSALSDGNWFHDTSGNTLHYKPTSGVAGDHTVDRLERGPNIYLGYYDTSYITISNLTMTNCKGAIYSWNEQSNAITGIVVDSNTIKYCNSAIAVWAVGYENTGWTISNNTLQNIGEGILFSSSTGTIKQNKMLIYNNTLTNIGLTGSNATETWNDWLFASDLEGIGLQNLNDSQIYGNDISGNGMNGGIVLWSSASATFDNNLIYKNIVHDTPGPGIAGFGEGVNITGGNKFYYNIVYNCGTKPGTQGGFQLNRSDTDTNMVYNNVVYNCDSNYYLYALTDYWILKNNISLSPVDYHVKTSVLIGSNVLDYNLYYPDTGTLFDLAGAPYNFADWKTNSSQDAHSINPDPKVVSTVTPDFNLQSSSPARDAGTDVGMTSDYAGNLVPRGSAPDIGAYEYADTSLKIPASPSNLRISP